MTAPPTFGRRGLKGAPQMRVPPGAPPPRRLRSNAVIIGCAGAVALSFAAAAEYRHQRCQPQDPADPHSIPEWCRNSSHSSYHGSTGHGFFGGAGGGFGSAASHASFGGFGGHGAGHGGGS